MAAISDPIATPQQGLPAQPAVLVDKTGTSSGTQANPLATNQVVGTPITNSNTGAAGAQVQATLTGTPTTKVYINGFIITTHSPAANVTGTVTVAGVVGGTMNFTLCESSTIGGEMIIFFPDPIPATAVNTPIVVTLPAITSGAVGSVVAVGYYM